MNKKTVEFEAYVSGDYECFCFAVDLKTFKKLMGRKPDQFEKDCFIKGKYQIYPNHIFSDNENILLHVKVEVYGQDNTEIKNEKNQRP